MKTVVKKIYEGMFLVDSAEAAADQDEVITAVKNILKKAKADIISIRKWDERKLAYEIKGKSRGTYILCYFKSNGEKIRDIERDVQLSERILRVLILSADHMTQENIEKAAHTIQTGKSEQKAIDNDKATTDKAKPQQPAAQQETTAEKAVEAEQPEKEEPVPAAEPAAANPDKTEPPQHTEAKDPQQPKKQQEETNAEMSS